MKINRQMLRKATETWTFSGIVCVSESKYKEKSKTDFIFLILHCDIQGNSKLLVQTFRGVIKGQEKLFLYRKTGSEFTYSVK